LGQSDNVGWSTPDAGVTELLTNPFLRADKDDPRFIAFGQKIGVMPKTAPKANERRTAQLGGKRMKPRMYANRRELLLQRQPGRRSY